VCSTTPAHSEIAGSSDRLYGNECCRALLYGAIAGIRHPQRLAVSGHVRLRRLGTESSPDSLLEGDGFELFVPRHESPEFRGIAGSSTRNDACPAFHRNGVFVAARRPSRDTLRRAITRILSDGSVPISAASARPVRRRPCRDQPSATMANRSKVLRASRSIRFTVTMSPWAPDPPHGAPAVRERLL
jgi:hypothetical protein